MDFENFQLWLLIYSFNFWFAFQPRSAAIPAVAGSCFIFRPVDPDGQRSVSERTLNIFTYVSCHVCLTGNVYEFLGVETDTTKAQCDSKVVVLAFKSNETGFYFLCARDGNSVALQVVVITRCIFYSAPVPADAIPNPTLT